MMKFKSVNFQQQVFNEYALPQKYPGQTEWIIGRCDTCDLILDSPVVSSVHGRIQFSEGEYYFVDLGSRNGSFVNGKDVQPNQRELLQLGDLLQLAETYLHIEELEPVDLSVPSIMPSHLQGSTWTAEEITVRCCRIIQETSDVRTFYFVAEPAVRFDHYLPGQFTNLAVEIDGQQVIRPYSISSSPTCPGSLALTIKRVPSSTPDVPPGLVSNWLHDNLIVGDRLKLLGGSLGGFTFLPDAPSRLLLISAGSGITPMMSMARWAYDSFADIDIVFLHSACTPEDIPFYDELLLIDKHMPNFQLEITVTRQRSGVSWAGHKGRISSAMLQLLTPDLHERSVFVCGPDGFMHGIRSILEDLDFPMDNYHQESFGGFRAFEEAPDSPEDDIWAEESAQQEHIPIQQDQGQTQLVTSNSSSLNGYQPDSASVVTFTKSQKEIAGDRDRSILELAEEARVSIPKACRMGACGTCKVKVAQGSVEYKATPTNLTSADKEAGYTLACIAAPVGRVAVEA
ncbi:FHA domain-containing protein (plasmid) [Phormidium sp. CLA17]|uniref:FHA domain-containing protein n=1 Tax=Leptolyngbya sp. Cla-17 TaxID=2803751 RepID=UPI001491EC04|nr:FHA domain-containing protein [Leptolyngbya sp. Cla-17]MBM0744883.1 FHA domain-containing protein [Leptolyngbya sp. Cla-17]